MTGSDAPSEGDASSVPSTSVQPSSVQPSSVQPSGRALPLVVIDAANVVGSVPDGWWRDRAAATRRLRDALRPVASDGLLLTADGDAPGASPRSGRWRHAPPYELVLVVEGAARGVEPVDGVRVVAADGSGDDAIVELVRRRDPDRPALVVTADRGLRERVAALGADVLGPSSVRRR